MDDGRSRAQGYARYWGPSQVLLVTDNARARALEAVILVGEIRRLKFTSLKLGYWAGHWWF